MTLLAELEEFVADHRSLGTLTGDATVPSWNGYLLIVACVLVDALFIIIYLTV